MGLAYIRRFGVSVFHVVYLISCKLCNVVLLVCHRLTTTYVFHALPGICLHTAWSATR